MPDQNQQNDSTTQDQGGNSGKNASGGSSPDSQNGNKAQSNGGADNNQKKGSSDDGDKKEEKKPMEPRKKRTFLLLSVVGGLVIVVLLALWLIYTGTYETTDDAQVDGHLNSIASRVNGTVIGVYAENNQPVKAGQVLVRLDRSDLEATASQSKAQYDQAVAKLAMDFPTVPIQENTNAGTVDQDQAQVNNAKATLRQSQKDYESKIGQLQQAMATNEKAQKDLIRYRELMEKREIAPSDYDQYVATAKQNQATVETNEKNVESGKQVIEEKRATLQQQESKMRQDRANAPQQTAMRKSQLDSDKASIAQAKAQNDADMLNLTYTEIRSPVDGVASQRNAELGARVNEAQQVMVVVQTQNQFVTANFKETQLKKMRVGQHVTMKVDALGKSFNGTVDYMPAATGDRNSLFPPENATGNYVKVVQRLPVRIRFEPNQDGLDSVRPGMSVETKVHF